MDLKDLQHGRKGCKHGAVQLGPDMLLIYQQIGKGAFASVYKVSIDCKACGPCMTLMYTPVVFC